LKQFASFVVKKKWLVLIVALLLAALSVIGVLGTGINYDILSYLPNDLESVIGEHCLDKDFNIASTAMVTVKNMNNSDVLTLKSNISKIDGVENVYWIDDVANLSIPKDVLPLDLKNTFYSGDGNGTLILVTFSNSDSSMSAIKNIKELLPKDGLIGGLSAVSEDNKELTEREVPIYVLIAVVLVLIVLFMGMESTVVPFLVIAGIGFAIVYNFGTNFFMGQISFITQALASVLQLGVTMDFSIFLIHRYEEEKAKESDKDKAMTTAITMAFHSIFGSSLTAIAGFLALCTMSFTLGYDIGIVMAKGVLLGVVSTFTILPALILVFDKQVQKYRHKTFIPKLKKSSHFIVKYHVPILLVFIVVLIPFIYGNFHTQQYYNLINSLPDSLISVKGANRLKEDYNMTATDFILVDENLSSTEVKEMTDKIKALDGITLAASYKDYVGDSIPSDILPDDIKSLLVNNGRQLIVANSTYETASKEQDSQLDKIDDIVKSYDENALITGEAPMTKDLVTVADRDFKSVNYASIIAVFIIIAVIFKSVSIPIILVAGIEAAVMINMGIPYYTGTILPFIASIVIGTIQLGSTINYAILLTNRFREGRSNGHDTKEAVRLAIENSSRSIFSSGLAFFAATIGVSMISDVKLIQSLCLLVSRGAIISMFVILFVFPSLLIIFSGVIEKTTFHWLKPQKNLHKSNIEITEGI
jgi:predicted RND superfamily exporter protein